MANDWITHVKKYAKDHNIKYGDAMKKAKATYKKGSPSKTDKGELDFSTKKGGSRKTARKAYEKKSKK